MGPLSQIMAMLPGMPQGLSSSLLDEQGGKKLKHFTCVMDSMTEQELESDSKLFREQPRRIYRLALGSGISVQEIQELLLQHGTVLNFLM
jgi:signal recognition particle subunit SRP54